MIISPRRKYDIPMSFITHMANDVFFGVTDRQYMKFYATVNRIYSQKILCNNAIQSFIQCGIFPSNLCLAYTTLYM